jgi:hypothetical protein
MLLYNSGRQSTHVTMEVHWFTDRYCRRTLTKGAVQCISVGVSGPEKTLSSEVRSGQAWYEFNPDYCGHIHIRPSTEEQEN